ncbi:sugar phosphate isomerase/epimerase [Citrobacter portucalensis]|uniref:sugar phosphate isomerase/epimerase family protein n=1 Tax=Citrobacter portucalensis TaxID=1639133 RepID=UPI001EF8AAF9|nr:sugar phosphate isomerase/epimerase [Citrobacter portucalensis]ULK55288.1 sugar phosphate isomerase/epimerase [Citrobacter portucalensis]
MSRKIIVVTAAYGYETVRAAGGQVAMLPVIAQSGAQGVEIRREMFSVEELNHLPSLAHTIRKHNLQACYSAPEPLYLPDSSLNPQIPALLEEARTLNAQWLKVSLGHFGQDPAVETLQRWLADAGVPLVVENDQTECGQLPIMQRFQVTCHALRLPITLTFDMGNWLWAGSSPEEAAHQLAPSVSYIHVKAAVPYQNTFCAIAPEPASSRWLALLQLLPTEAPLGIEFPLEGPDLTAVTQYYVTLLRKAGTARVDT